MATPGNQRYQKIDFMKFPITCLLALMIFSFPACSKKASVSTEKPAASSTPLPLKTDSTVDENYRFIVSFYSIGSGTEREQINILEKFLAGYIPAGIKYEKSFWGREGEVNYCMKLSEIIDADQKKFIDSAKEALKSAKWVHFSEYAVCGGRRR